MTETDNKALSRGISRDMSAEAISRRLRIASDLHDVATMLGKAKRVGRVEPIDGAELQRSTPHENVLADPASAGEVADSA